MQVHAMYWSATGTTKKVATTVADTLAEEGTYQVFDFTLPAARQRVKTFGANDVVVFALPTYAGRVPNLLLGYLNTVVGGGALAIPVVTFGNRSPDDSLVELRNILEQQGFHTVAGAAFPCQHAFSKVLGAGRPDKEDLAIAQNFARQVAQKLRNKSYTTPVWVEGQSPLRPYYTPRDREGNPINILKVKPQTNLELCDHCGVCAAICPMGSINSANEAEVPGICIKCCACEKRCHTGAKYFDDPGYLYHREELELEFTRRAEPHLFF